MQTSFVENYKAKHQHPLNRLSHSIGIPLIVVSLPLFLWSWRWALALFVAGWVFQFVGHWIEGNSPAFFRNPVYLIVGPVWLVRRALTSAGILRGPRGTLDERAPRTR
ncbi:MAG TPA: DUF962 domain-containing protein [Pyrinomonadaceae bacterium]|jgi:uncharacterized membrane protein YGL010W|nr:DUF962 domain-containing protein [Pyrinomonadaceae bacterium]